MKEGGKMECGGLIGIMVGEKDDIAKIDLSKLQAPKAVTVEESKPEMKQKDQSSSALAPGSDDFFAEFDEMVHKGAFKISPAAGAWMRNYMILPQEVQPTGPKGFVLKSDVLSYIEKNKLVKG